MGQQRFAVDREHVEHHQSHGDTAIAVEDAAAQKRALKATSSPSIVALPAGSNHARCRTLAPSPSSTSFLAAGRRPTASATARATRLTVVSVTAMLRSPDCAEEVGSSTRSCSYGGATLHLLHLNPNLPLTPRDGLEASVKPRWAHCAGVFDRGRWAGQGRRGKRGRGMGTLNLRLDALHAVRGLRP